MNSRPPPATQAPRPLRRNPWPALLAGAAIVVMAGNVACKPVAIDEYESLSMGAPLFYDVEWTGQDNVFSTWDGYIRS